MVLMMKKNITKEYFEWLYSNVCNDIYGKNTYHYLLDLLYHTEFIPTLDRDINRAQDGIDFRYRFGHDRGYSSEEIDDILCPLIGPCNMLEMMIALSTRIENLMDDPDYGNRTGQWFWSMIVSLEINTMNDKQFDENYIYDCLERFINREYAPNGKGGLFTLDNPDRDLTDVEIWYQAMWYLDELSGSQY